MMAFQPTVTLNYHMYCLVNIEWNNQQYYNYIKVYVQPRSSVIVRRTQRPHSDHLPLSSLWYGRMIVLLAIAEC
jgi:hypothetical protein